MPTLPNIQTSQSVFSSGALQSQQIQSDPNDFGAQVGQAAGQLGTAVQNAGQTVTDVAQKWQAIQNETDVNHTYANDYMPGMRDLQQQYLQLGGKDATDQYPTYQQKMQELHDTVRTNLNPAAQRMFDDISNRTSQMMLDGMSRYAGQQNVVYQDQTSRGMINNSVTKAVTAWNDPIVFDAAKNEIVSEDMQHGQFRGQPIEYINAQIQKDLSTATTSRLRTMANTDPVGAYDLLKNGENWTDSSGVSHHNNIGAMVDPTEYASIEHQLMQGAKEVSADRTASNAITPPPAGATAPVPALQAAIMKNESNGKDVDASGNVLTSPAGAQGNMQVMPSTNLNPGYGVTPARDNSAAERTRVGNDYVGAMSARYGNNPALVAASYNAGPGMVDDWLNGTNKTGKNPSMTQLPDPSKGQISNADFIAKIPFTETKAYAGKVLASLPAQTNGPTTLPNAQDLETSLPDKAAAAKVQAQQQFPNDPAYAENVYNRVMQKGNQITAGIKAQQSAATQTLYNAIAGSKPDGSDKISSMNDITSNPNLNSAYQNATPEVRLAVQSRLAKGDQQFDSTSAASYYQLKGMAANDPANFAKLDLGAMYGTMPDSAWKQLIDLQTSTSKNDAAQASKNLNWARTKGDVEDMLKPLGLGTSAKPNTTQADTTTQFYGKLNDALEDYHNQNQKYPDTTTTRKIAGSLLVQGTQQSGHWYSMDSKMPAFQSPDLTQFSVPVPQAQKAQLAQSFQKVMGRPASDQELQQWYTKFTLANKGK
ncbi:Soluble lytic murein transglycosylase precursor [Collimonas arenae]|uniref:Soluble lytic murein transglycosylase n=1 Tax=Collimonas arenae TaxID=279058 RepID=A0A0A1F664_9BURK|nr:transglycosylase SLT domain-containing protein [Collimonas arenae]AIY40193.1 Soluble lytic murein transglycosylase precursor [Collimonas arenae]